MTKYFLIAKNTWDEVFTYRLNFIMYRIRNILTFLTMYYLWYALLPAGTSHFGFTQQSILTYVLGSAFLQAFILASRSYAIGDDIVNGNLSNFLIKPFNYFFYWFAKDLGDKAMNISFAIIELTVLFLLLRPPVFIQTDPVYLSFFFVSMVFAVMLYFFFNMILGMIGFWSVEIWAPRFIFMVLIGFFSGGYFPLDILPESVYTLFTALPFQYLIYFPLKIYLGQIPIHEIVAGILTSLVWIVLLHFSVQFLWKKGVEVYTAHGR